MKRSPTIFPRPGQAQNSPTELLFYAGMDEIYNESDLNMNPNDEEVNREAKEARSFLRFGKKSENYLRFGKRVYDDRHGKRSENYLRFGKRFGEISNKKRNEEEEYR